VDKQPDDTDPTPAPRRAPMCRFGPDRRLTALTAVLAAVAIGLAVVTNDAAGRLLFVGAALVLAAYAATDLYYWPRLAADADAVTVRSPLGSARLRWADIDAVRADVREHLGMRATTLEIDAGERLLVFSRRALGADPAQVAGLIRAFDPR
jgi:hypothetical protein